MQHPAPPEKLALVAEPASAVRVRPLDAGGERFQQLGVKVGFRGVLDGRTVVHGRFARRQECLLLKVGEEEITVVAAEIRLACALHPARLGRSVALVDPCDDDGRAIDYPVTDVQPDRRHEPARLRGQALLELLGVR